MKRILIIFALLCYPTWATPAFVQAGACNEATSNCTIMLGSSTTAGDTLVVFVLDNSNGTQTICDGSCSPSTDTFLNRIPTAGSPTTSGVGGTYDSLNIAPGVTTITCTGASATKIACVALEISGIRRWDATPSGNVGSSSTSWTSNSFSTAAASEIAIGCAGTINTESVSSPQIGGHPATLDAHAHTPPGSTISAACIYLVLSSVQSNIDASATVVPANAYIFDALTYVPFPTQAWVIMP